jgi:hypothetical protein
MVCTTPAPDPENPDADLGNATTCQVRRGGGGKGELRGGHRRDGRMVMMILAWRVRTGRGLSVETRHARRPLCRHRWWRCVIMISLTRLGWAYAPAVCAQCQSWYTLTLPSAAEEEEEGSGSPGTGAVSRPFPSWDRSILTEIYLCHTCSCQEIFRTETAEQAAAKGHTVLYCQEGPGWKPPPSMLAAAVKGRQPKPANPYGHQWRAVPLSVGGDGPAGTVSATADLAALGGRYPHAVRLAWPLAGTAVGKDDDMCCVSQASLDGRAPCVPGNCPLYSAVSELPANPFFARCDPVSAALACAVRAHKR